MHSELDQFKRLCQTLSQHRKLCTGEAIPLPDIGTWPQRVRTEADFTALVSAAYKLWRENWKLDIGFFLSQPRADGLIHAFDQLIYHLRTAQQHTDNSDATARWEHLDKQRLRERGSCHRRRLVRLWPSIDDRDQQRC
ncbi:hypothetical protein SALBM311S_09496 [Streptomyces alboniger]